MAGYFTWKRDVHKRLPQSVGFSPGYTPQRRTHQYSFPLRQVTTSFRTRGAAKDRNDHFGKRDPFESFYAYGSWRHDTGHPFQTDKSDTWLTHPYAFAEGRTTGNIYVSYAGPMVPTGYGTFGANPLPFSAINSSYWGAKLIAETVPTNPTADVAVSLAELIREGISLPGSQFILALKGQTSFLRSVGSEYLNLEFGWKPLISDLKDILRAVTQSREILENLEKNSGKAVRRRRTLDVIPLVTDYSIVSPLQTWLTPTGGSDTVSQALFQGYPGGSGVLRRRGPLERVDRVTEQYSFSGAYTYFFENGSDPISRLRGFEQKANLLLGTRVLTPEVLWELAPWSWLADWFGNFGHLATNVTRFSQDGLVMKYGYLMRHSVSTRIYTQNGVTFRSNTGPGPFSITLKNERKERVRATPFGFGLNPSSFDARQWAILAALGLTKTPSSLF